MTTRVTTRDFIATDPDYHPSQGPKPKWSAPCRAETWLEAANQAGIAAKKSLNLLGDIEPLVLDLHMLELCPDSGGGDIVASTKRIHYNADFTVDHALHAEMYLADLRDDLSPFPRRNSRPSVVLRAFVEAMEPLYKAIADLKNRTEALDALPSIGVMTGVATRWASEQTAARAHAIVLHDGYIEVDFVKARRRKKPDNGGLIYATVTDDNEKRVNFAPSKDFGAMTKKGRTRFRVWRHSGHRTIDVPDHDIESAVSIVDEIVKRLYSADWSGIDRYEWSRAQAAAYVALHARDDDFDALTTLFARAFDGLDIDPVREEYVIESLVDFAQGAFLDKPMPVVIARRLEQLEAQVVEEDP